jgi:hypothetical protein
MPVPADVALELVAEAVLPLPDRDLAGDPEGAAEPGIAVIPQLCLSPESARLLGFMGV